MSVTLKLLRIQNEMTLEELAQATDLTRSYLSKLERGVSTPSISTALKIAKALKVSVEALFADAASDDPVVISRAPVEKASANKATPRVVSGALAGQKMMAFVLSPSDEPVRNHPMSHHKGEEILFVLKGTVSLQLSKRTEILEVGDSAHFNSSIPHKIVSVGKQPASVLLVIASDE